MYTNIKQGTFWFPVLLLFYTLFIPFVQGQSFSTQQLTLIGKKVFHNECTSKKACLVAWNDGEDFASLGIGHFIWYPTLKDGAFEESFPALLQFMQTKKVVLPIWLSKEDPNAPWINKKQFVAEYYSQQTQELIQFLNETKTIQVMFIVHRFTLALPKILESIDAEQHVTLRHRFERIATSAQGMYALIDYVNFKGEGSNPNERYQGKGWGLLQVLQQIDAQLLEQQPNHAFAQAAEQVLRQRIKLSPPQRHEKRWLAGWLKRIQTYR